MKKIGIILFAALFTGLTILHEQVTAQISFGGDLRLRVLHDEFSESLDDRDALTYMRYLGRINASANVSGNTRFYSEFTTITDNDEVPVRGIAGSGQLMYGLSQIYAETVYSDVGFIDLMRFRIGRQQFPIGGGLSQGESAYFINLFDGVRSDLSTGRFRLSLMGAVTRQNLSPSGLFPAPGGDRIYIGRLATTIAEQDLMSYFIYNDLEGLFNDSYIAGIGGRGNIFFEEMDYFWEVAHQRFNQAPGLPEMSGLGYMFGIGHRWPMGPFRWFKIETRFAGFEGNDPETERIGRFSPQFPSFFWGDRAGFANPFVGGDYPREGRDLGGSHIWYIRAYVVPHFLPQSRFQVQYIRVREWVDADNFNPYNNEFAARFFYEITRNSRIQLRYVHRRPNEDEIDPETRLVSSATDLFKIHRFMLEWHVWF